MNITIIFSLRIVKADMFMLSWLTMAPVSSVYNVNRCKNDSEHCYGGDDYQQDRCYRERTFPAIRHFGHLQLFI